jgi:hypothetical protein
MTIIFDFDGVSSELVRIYEKHKDQHPENKRFKFLGSFYGDDENVNKLAAGLAEANEWLRATYAPDLSPEVFSAPAAKMGEHSPFTIALGALLKDIKEDLSSKGIV